MRELDPKIVQWQNDYEETLKNPPKKHDILGTLDGQPVRLYVDLKAGSEPFVYGQAYVPEIVGGKLGWFVQSIESSSRHGWKIVLVPQARQELLMKYGVKHSVIPIKSLRVLAVSRTGSSILSKVEEFLSDDDYELSLQAIEARQKEMTETSEEAV